MNYVLLQLYPPGYVRSSHAEMTRLLRNWSNYGNQMVIEPFLCNELFVSAEVLELAGNASRDNKKKRVIPRHILLAIANDEELHEVYAPFLGISVDLF